MAEIVTKLNEILADEWACVRALRRAESLCDDPGKLEVIKRVRKDCSVNCVNLANVVRAFGAGPTDIPSARFSLKLIDESLSDCLDLVQSAQVHIVAAVDALIDSVELKSCREALLLVRKLHTENIPWLKSAMSATG